MLSCITGIDLRIVIDLEKEAHVKNGKPLGPDSGLKLKIRVQPPVWLRRPQMPAQLFTLQSHSAH